MTSPKLFISYSWSSTEHEQWVLQLATELRESGVDVILDKWDLKEGHDAIVFMEQMVNDPDIGKVVLICDQEYSAKADGRSGGVGTETQIISKEIYEQQSQEKFVAVVCEKDEAGKAYLPAYYRSRIYIDLSEDDRYSENFEKLLRWVFDKPLYVKPEIGTTPSFLESGDHVSLGTTAAYRRCIDAIKNQKSYAKGSFDEYCNILAHNLDRFRLKGVEGEFDDAVIKSVEDFLPYRNEAIQVFSTIAQYGADEEYVRRIHKLFEELIPYMHRPKDVNQWNDWDFDNFRFVVHELFLYALACLLRNERFEVADILLGQQYYLPGNMEYGHNAMRGFVALREYMRSLEHRNKRLDLRRLSLRADVLRERCTGVGIEFRELMQADFIAFMRAEIEAEEDFSMWWPETLLYCHRPHGPFEMFARARSRAYFEKIKHLLLIDKPKDLEPLLQSYADRSRRLPRWEFEGFSPVVLLGYKELCTRP
ncbi:MULTISPECIES: toll/interleukin-1 receptor domain-containing protein [unclassified Thioalkalivibrio]|uniref:toll/interleukin-1 receptor domain-containing protein n=1 Tax=unclassified Thioalkalivibrio TaxID=2621013 RepID=UPI000369FAC9|nr:MULTISPECIES: toll/interleukin-1 receptor domain-containing protein [unclassified Thioalkalivibrio]